MIKKRLNGALVRLEALEIDVTLLYGGVEEI
jgi:hypothetical protein